MQRIQTDAQRALALVVGVDTDAESRVIAGGAGETVVLFDRKANTRRPVLIRVQNLSATEPIYVSEDLRNAAGAPEASAALFTGILAYDTVGQDKGFGAIAEFQKHRPNCVSLFGTNAWRAVVTIRYVDEN